MTVQSGEPPECLNITAYAHDVSKANEHTRRQVSQIIVYLLYRGCTPFELS